MTSCSRMPGRNRRSFLLRMVLLGGALSVGVAALSLFGGCPPAEDQSGQDTPPDGQPALVLSAQQKKVVVTAAGTRYSPLGPAELSELRAAAGEMRRASQSFRRGDVKRGIQQARRAQRILRRAMHRLKVSQYESLEQAIAAAQDGAMALVANQDRIARGTRQSGKRVGDLTGQPGQGAPDQGQPCKGEPGKAQPGTGAPGQGQPSKGEPVVFVDVEALLIVVQGLCKSLFPSL